MAKLWFNKPLQGKGKFIRKSLFHQNAIYRNVKNYKNDLTRKDDNYFLNFTFESLNLQW